MRFIGGKSLLLDDIMDVIKKNTKDVNRVIDIFSGSGAVAGRCKAEGYETIANDVLYFSYCLNRGTLNLNRKPDFAGLTVADPIGWLNSLTIDKTSIRPEECFIYQNYSPNANCGRMYFQNKNALKIDLIRITIERWRSEEKINEDEYFYLLAALVAAVPFVSNIAGVYGAYLKKWDVRTYGELTLREPELIASNKACFTCNREGTELLKRISGDLLYADPPYNARQYLPNYHVLETIARYDNPVIKGVTGMREYEEQKSDFCRKGAVKRAFETMIENAQVRYVIISYNNEGLLPTQELSGLCEKYARKGSFRLIEKDYRRYKSKIVNDRKGLCEQIYFFEKEGS